jgi:hypothetical protein
VRFSGEVSRLGLPGGPGKGREGLAAKRFLLRPPFFAVGVSRSARDLSSLAAKLDLRIAAVFGNYRRATQIIW